MVEAFKIEENSAVKSGNMFNFEPAVDNDGTRAYRSICYKLLDDYAGTFVLPRSDKPSIIVNRSHFLHYRNLERKLTKDCLIVYEL